MQTLNDVLGTPKPQAGSPVGEMVPMDLYGPADVEEIFQDPREKFKDPRQPTQVRTAAMGAGSVPVPSRPPEMSQNRDDLEGDVPPMPERGERSPAMHTGPLVSPNDSRYSDVNNLIVGDVITGGLLPWIQATADLASGRIPVERFDEARQEHERRIEELKAGHSHVVQAAEKAMPFLSGLGIGLLKPAKTVAGTIGRGAAVAGAEGFVQGATSGPVEEPSFSSTRLGQGVGQAAENAALGGFGAALPGGAKEAKDMLGRRADRIAREDEAAASAAARRAKSQKTQQTKQTRLAEKQRADAEKAKDDKLVERFKSYRDVVGKPVKDWKEKRNLLNEHPEIVFKAQAKMNPDLADFSRQVNLPPVAILNKLRGAKIKPETAQEKILQQQLEEIDESWQAVRRRGSSDAPATSTTGNSAGPAAASAGAAGKPAKTPSGRPGAGSKRGSTKSAPAPRKPGDEPIRVPSKPNRSDRDY